MTLAIAIWQPWEEGRKEEGEGWRKCSPREIFLPLLPHSQCEPVVLDFAALRREEDIENFRLSKTSAQN